MTRSKIERDTQSVPTPLRDSFSIWRLLNRKGRLSPKTHDERFVADLRKTLEVPRGEEIDAFLKRASPNTTAFTIAVLNAFEPMGRMLSDIYAMFARHGLKESDDKVLIEFDFGAAKDKLQFDSDHFRRTLQGLSKLRQAMYSYEFYAKDLWEIARQIGDALADSNAQPQAQNVYKRTLGKSKQGELASFLSEPHSQAYTIWLKGSLDVARNWDRWPYVAPPPFPEFSVGDAVAEAMTPFVSATQRLCEVSSRYPTYEAMRVAADRDNPSTEPGTNLRATVNAWGLSVSRLAQSDRLGEYCLRLIWHVFELAPLEGEARMDLARRIAQIVEANSNRVEAFHLTNAIEDLLDLPMWKYRHQIYSIWLVTVIERAFGDPGQFLLTGRDGHLIFAFVETPVAQLRANGVEMELVSELRTSSGNLELTGKGRTSSVQPDYVIRSTDGSTIGRVRYVLEAKQYAKASLRNFSRALRDYAVVHTNAVVALANYGPMPSTVTAELAALTAKMKDKRVIERCKAFGNVEPTYPASVLA